MTPRRWIVGLALALVVTAAGCATTRVASAEGGTTRVQDSLLQTVAFEHGCAPERVVVLRELPLTTIDVDACGRARRYKRFGEGISLTWVDVTTLYPPESLPAPARR